MSLYGKLKSRDRKGMRKPIPAFHELLLKPLGEKQHG